MAANFVVFIEYAGDILSDQITSGPWHSVYANYPEHGGIPYKPQFDMDVLQPRNVDGARYRILGAHFPVFRLRTIVPVTTFSYARLVAREHELCKGDQINIVDTQDVDVGDASAVRCQVLDVTAVASAKRVLGATTVDGAEWGTPDSYGCVDTEWTLQKVLL